MVELTIIPRDDGEFPEMAGAKLQKIQRMKIAGLAAGMESGAPSVAIVIPLEDGSFVFAETSLKLFLTAADVLKAVHGDPRDGKPGDWS